MGLGIGVVAAALRLRAATALHRAWTAALLAMLLLPLWTSYGPSVTAHVLPAVAVTAPVAIPEISSPLEAAATPTPLAASTPPAPSRPIWPDRRGILLVLYLCGAAIMLARLIRGSLLIRSLARDARRAEGVATSDLCAAPVTIGWLRPVLILPEGWRVWPTEKLQAVLIHEREHARRRDPLVQWLALLNRCIFWFHPLAWWLERKLAALAEEACDAAVLSHGHAPHDYANHLIELARSVNAAGARLRWAGAVAFSAGDLSRRVRRIVDAQPAPPISRAKSAASAALCVVILAALLACNVGRSSKPAHAQCSMTNQEPSRLLYVNAPGLQNAREDALLSDAALGLTPQRAKVRELDLKRSPGDQLLLLELLRYYQVAKDIPSLNALTFWYIEHYPAVRANWADRPAWDQVWDAAGYERGAQLWNEQLKKPWQSPYVPMNAAEYFSGYDNERAEQILLDGRTKFSSAALHWEVLLARHYAWALSGGEGQLSQNYIVTRRTETTAPFATTPYAQKVRETLLASNDMELIKRVLEQLQTNRPALEFSQALVSRMLAVDPKNPFALSKRENLRRWSIQLRARTDPSSLSATDRMVSLEGELLRLHTRPRAAIANELLALAAQNAKDADYGTAIFLANLTLGEEAMDRGDVAGAAQRLLAAADAPPTEFLRQWQIDMSLARRLLNAERRETVTKFLDRCAKFNRSGQRLSNWAAQIRQGLNPDLVPASARFPHGQSIPAR